MSKKSDKSGQDLSDKDRQLWGSVRQGILIILGAIEDRFGFERTKEPRHKRRGK